MGGDDVFVDAVAHYGYFVGFHAEGFYSELEDAWVRFAYADHRRLYDMVEDAIESEFAEYG